MYLIAQLAKFKPYLILSPSPYADGERCHLSLIQSSSRLNVTRFALWFFITVNAHAKYDL